MDGAAESVYVFDNKFEVTSGVKKAYDENGFILVRGLFDQAEITKLREAVENDDGIAKHAYKIDDGFGKKIRMCLWKYPGNDITGMASRCEKVAVTSEKLLGDAVSHYHTKLMMKDEQIGGQFAWHQDYGYWYDSGFLTPNMLTVFMPLDPCTKDNGCLQIMKGTHKCGRVDHVFLGAQRGADPKRIEEIEKVFPLIHVEMQPGDAVFFHSNILHRSSSNESATRRWAFVSAYAPMNNLPCANFGNTTDYWRSHTFEAVKKVPNSALMECTNVTDTSEKDFMNPEDDNLINYKPQDN